MLRGVLRSHFLEHVDHDSVQERCALHHIFKFRILIFDEEKEDPKDCHKVELRLLVQQRVLATHFLEHCPVFFVHAVAELYSFGLCTKPLRDFPPFCSLPGDHFQQLFS